MQRTLFAAVVVLSAIVLFQSVPQARAQTSTAFTRCVVLKTDYVNSAASLEKRDDIGEFPTGWTPIGGTAVPKGTVYTGAVVLCR